MKAKRKSKENHFFSSFTASTPLDLRAGQVSSRSSWM
jgi:hypothetical protein